MEKKDKRELLVRYINAEVGLRWREDVLPQLQLNGYGSDRSEDIVDILAPLNNDYRVFSSALNLNTDDGNRRFKQIFDGLQAIYHPVPDETKNEILEKLLTTQITTPNPPLHYGGSASARQNYSPYHTDKSFSFLKQNISGGKNLELFDYLIGELPQNSRPQIVKDAVDSLHKQRSFNKEPGLSSIKNSLNQLINIVNNHSGVVNLQTGVNSLEANFVKLMRITLLPREILESFPAEEGFTKMKEILDSSGVGNDKRKNEYIKHFVEQFFAEDMIGSDQKKLPKLDYYIRRACNGREDEIYELKNKIIKPLYDKNISYKLDESFWDFILKQENPITLIDVKNLIIHIGSIDKVNKKLKDRNNEQDNKTSDAIFGGRLEVANDCEFLRKVLQRGDKNLLNELMGGSQPLINKEQIFASVDFNAQNQSFQPIREAFNKNQDLAALNCLALLFSKLPNENTKTILRDLIPPIQQAQDNADNFLTDLLSKNLDSARLLIDLANKADLKENTKSLLSHLINTKSIFSGNGNYIESLNMMADNGPLSIKFIQQGIENSRELTGTELFKEVLLKDQFYTRQESPLALLQQYNPAALAFFFEKTGGVETEENKQMIRRLNEYLSDTNNQKNKNSDACQNSLMFLLTKNTNPQLQENFARFLTANDPNNLKKTDDKKLIKAICDSIFTEKDGNALASDFQKLNINPLLEAGKIFQHFDNKEVRAEKTKISLGFGKAAVFKIINKQTRAEKQLSPEVSLSIPLKLVGYDIGKKNPLLANDATAKDLTLKLNDRLLVNGFKPIRKLVAKVPATAVDPTETNAVLPTQGTTQNL